jgi:hypothetical protein
LINIFALIGICLFCSFSVIGKVPGITKPVKAAYVSETKLPVLTGSLNQLTAQGVFVMDFVSGYSS